MGMIEDTRFSLNTSDFFKPGSVLLRRRWTGERFVLRLRLLPSFFPAGLRANQPETDVVVPVVRVVVVAPLGRTEVLPVVVPRPATLHPVGARNRSPYFARYFSGAACPRKAGSRKAPPPPAQPLFPHSPLLFPLPSSLFPLCSLLFALCSFLFALSSLLTALCSLLFAHCSLLFAHSPLALPRPGEAAVSGRRLATLLALGFCGKKFFPPPAGKKICGPPPTEESRAPGTAGHVRSAPRLLRQAAATLPALRSRITQGRTSRKP